MRKPVEYDGSNGGVHGAGRDHVADDCDVDGGGNGNEELGYSDDHCESGSDAGERTADGDGGCSLHGKLESSGRDGPFDLGDYGGIDSAGFDV